MVPKAAPAQCGSGRPNGQVFEGGLPLRLRGVEGRVLPATPARSVPSGLRKVSCSTASVCRVSRGNAARCLRGPIGTGYSYSVFFSLPFYLQSKLRLPVLGKWIHDLVFTLPLSLGCDLVVPVGHLPSFLYVFILFLCVVLAVLSL